KPVDAHRDCPTCSGKVQLWYRGDEVFRVTARKDEWNEVKYLPDGKPGWICNTCRYDKKETKDWVIEQPSHVSRTSVIRQGHYEGKVGMVKPDETIKKVMNGRDPKLLINI